MTDKEREIVKELRPYEEAKECYTGEDLKHFYKLTCRSYNENSLSDVDFNAILKYLEGRGSF